MVKIEVITVPSDKENKEVSYKYSKVVEDRNKVIAKRFKMEAVDVTLKFFMSKGAIVSSLGPNGDGMGVYSGYIDGSNTILQLHPDAAEGLLEDINKEMGILIDNSLTRLYLCKKYYPSREDFKLYYKYVADSLASFSAGNFREGAIKFDVKMHVDGKRYRKDQELNIVFYVMLKNSGLDFIYEHLDKIMQDKDIKKTIFGIYKKTFEDLIKPEKELAIEEQRKKFELEKAKRQAQRDKARNASN